MKYGWQYVRPDLVARLTANHVPWWRRVTPYIIDALILLVIAFCFTVIMFAQAPSRWTIPVDQKTDERTIESGNDNGFAFCRLQFPSNRREAQGNGWRTDYPKADQNFPTRLREVTSTRVMDDGRDREGFEQYKHWVVNVGSEALFMCPFVIASDVGTMDLDENEAANLNRYLAKGGMLWVDDFWGSKAWTQWLGEMAKFSDGDWVIETPTFEHPIFNMFVRIRETLQVSNLDVWRGRMGVVAERGDDSPVTPLRVLVDGESVVVVMTFNTDIQDTWEREHDDVTYFETFSPEGYALGINVLLYTMTH